MQIATRTTGGLIKVDVTTAGTGYTQPPEVIFSGGGGTGVQAIAHIDGGRVESVVLVNAGTGYTQNPTVSFNPPGAGAIAYACTESRPMSFFRGRYLSVYGVDGMGRGIRYILRPPSQTGDKLLETESNLTVQAENGLALITEYGQPTNALPIGINKPAMGPSVTMQAATDRGVIGAIQLVRGGAGYAGPPTVTLTGGSPTRPATARAVVIQGRVDRIYLTDAGAGYVSTPAVNITGGIGTAAQFSVGVRGRLESVDVANAGTGYTSNETTSPTVVFHNTQGLAGASARIVVNPNGTIDRVAILNAGTGATATGVTASITGGGGTGAELAVSMVYGIHAITVSSSGSDYWVPPVLTIQRNANDTESQTALAALSVNGSGNISEATVLSAGRYSVPPTAQITDSAAQAQASLRSALRGTYYCCFRYYDDTPPEENGPIYSSISELVEVDTGDAGGTLHWTFSHYSLDDRVVGMELWRTTSDQRTLLFRVARIARTDAEWTNGYEDTVNDVDIADTQRDAYGLMPVTLPSGQVNARRFAVPPSDFALGCMFQDRAWYARDTLGKRPNSLMFSEVDEPESVPPVNEIVVQENSVTADTIQALIPLGPSLIIAQSAHLYKLMYVSQPVIDASLTLAAYRGVLHDRCWAVMAGVAFLVDSHGMYAFDGQSEQIISAAVDDYWRDGVIDFSKANQFHVSADYLTKVVRFHYCKAEDATPIRALCYCAATQTWWEETYPQARTASNMTLVGNRWMQVVATGSGELIKHAGPSDSGTAIPYEMRTGPMPLDQGPSRSVAFVYKPTQDRSDLFLSLRYNNSQTPRPNAISSDRGSGFVTAQSGTAAALDMSKDRSDLAGANGFARAYVAGRRDDRSAGGDRHMAVGFAGTQQVTAGNGVVIYSMQVEGAG